ncbi:MAG TPA: hypothetical protein EYG52_02355 [Pseudomonadales bacterium]|nr:hypothetical protein [Pseudomonadales bacterium]
MWFRFCLLLVSATTAAADNDPVTGLARAEGVELVGAHCLVCHSSRLIVQNQLSREGWRQTIRYMQKNHNLWPLGEAEDLIVDYLVVNYGPLASSNRRRGNLPYLD